MSIGPWKPLWLGDDSRRLYGALHLPARPSSLPGVLFVPPLLHEQPRSRRFVTEVASGLAAVGLPCLRFDFFGTGDSAGGGNECDFGSMQRDLDTAIAALRRHGDVDRVVLLGWRGGALPLHAWLRNDGFADLLVFWEPIVDGQRWLAELQQADAAERRQRPRPRPGVPRLTGSDDGQLMGFAASIRFRRELAQAVVIESSASCIPAWAVLRSDASGLPIRLTRTFPLPVEIPTFGGGTDMEATFFLSPRLQRVVDQLGGALVEKFSHIALERTVQ